MNEVVLSVCLRTCELALPVGGGEGAASRLHTGAGWGPGGLLHRHLCHCLNHIVAASGVTEADCSWRSFESAHSRRIQ